MFDGSGPAPALFLLVVLIALTGVTTFVVVRRRRGGLDLRPRPDARTAPPPPPTTTSTVEPEAVTDLEIAELDLGDFPAAAPPIEITPPEAPAAQAPVEVAPVEVAPEPAAPVVEPEVKRGRVRSIRDRLAGFFGKHSIAEADLAELEEVLLRADLGMRATSEVIANLRNHKDLEPLAALRTELRAALGDPDRNLQRKAEGLSVWLITGVNGSGKTTTIGKLAAQARDEGHQVVLAAADTFRAAADEQLETWANRAGAEVVKHKHGADPAAVVFDGVKAAKARQADLLIVDTAGRLQNKTNLMEELSKIRRVLDREAGPPDEVLLILDATTGQNGLSQARAFAEVAGVTGIALTKLDGSAKGGIVVAVQQELGIPVKLVGLGEQIADLAPFDPDRFVDDLLA